MTQGGLITRWTRQSDRDVHLQTDVFRVDKMLANLAHHAATLSFDESANWGQILGAEKTFALAILATAEAENRAIPLQKAIAQAREAEPAQAGARITALVEAMLHLARDLDEWLTPAQIGGAMEHRWAHGLAEAALDQVLAPQLQRLFDQVAEAEESRLTAQWERHGWRKPDAQPWQNTVREGEMHGTARAVERAWAQRLIRQLCDAAQQFFECVIEASEHAAEALEERLQTGAHEGHAALIIAFAQVFRHARVELDALPQRVLDYWLTKLGAEPAPARGDRVLLAVLPRAGARPEVPKGLLVPAGKEATFVADTGLSVTAATLAEVRMWAPDGLAVCRAVPDTDGVIGEAVAEAALPTALLTSPLLALPGGTRRVRVRLVCETPPEVPSQVMVEVSTSPDWAEVEAHWAVEGDALLLSLLLPDSFPALVPCPGLDEPALRLTALAPINLQLKEAGTIEVAVRGAPGLTVSTPGGQASATAAAPFGTPPFVGGWLRIDHPALAGPPLDRMVLRFDWAGVPAGDAGFAGQYRGYVVDEQGALLDHSPFHNGAFTVTLKAPVRGGDARQEVPLFAALAPSPDVLSDRFEAAPPPMPDDVPLAPSSWLAAGAASEGAVDTDHILVTLASPPQAFGHALYPANVQ
ncbi:hypothetical protein LQ953_09155 [Sphingomonas sp. IC-56]|uniref:hypothetical protein n=1 Tax=Sphingomonas sp. IC-56 TaxID=2898529 RepID=UPI001E32F611|nr:hypothetical protein [Sphingomonas sp. IC-56]MCD2324177.1 hypothetical protein [Sphingomonas sp. IC-56]